MRQAPRTLAPSHTYTSLGSLANPTRVKSNRQVGSLLAVQGCHGKLTGSNVGPILHLEEI